MLAEIGNITGFVDDSYLIVFNVQPTGTVILRRSMDNKILRFNERKLFDKILKTAGEERLEVIKSSRLECRYERFG